MIPEYRKKRLSAMDVFSKQRRNPQLRNTIKTKVKMLPFVFVMIATKMFDRTLNDRFLDMLQKNK